MTLRKATTRHATVLRATRNTTIEHGNTPEWDATSEQTATNKPSGQRMPPTDGRKPFHEELRQSTPFYNANDAITANWLPHKPHASPYLELRAAAMQYECAESDAYPDASASNTAAI